MKISHTTPSQNIGLTEVNTMYELVKSSLLLTGLLMIAIAVYLLLPEYVDISSLEQTLAAFLG